MPKISIGIPVYNAEKYLQTCLISLFEQTYEDLEYIFVDDSCTDRSVEIINEVLCRYPNRKGQVKIIRHEKNRGSAASRNDCIDNATGEYLGWCDADDWVEPDMYEKLLASAQQEDADICYCNYVYEKGSSSTERIFDSENNGCDATKAALLCKNVPLILWNKISKLSLFKSHDIRCVEGYNVSEDYLVSVALFCVAGKISWVNECLYHYRNNLSSMGGVKGAKTIITPMYKQCFENVGFALSFVQKHDVSNLYTNELIWGQLVRNTQLLYNFNDIQAWKTYSKSLYSHINTNPGVSRKEKFIEKCLSHGFNLPCLIKMLYINIVRRIKGNRPLKQG